VGVSLAALLYLLLFPPLEERMTAELLRMEVRMQYLGPPRYCCNFLHRDPQTGELVEFLWAWKRVEILETEAGYLCRWSHWSWIGNRWDHYRVMVDRLEIEMVQPPPLHVRDGEVVQIADRPLVMEAFHD
jgi:hypothetical protein